LLSTGENPMGDSYQVTVKTDLAKITAIRLETLTHNTRVSKFPTSL